MELTLLCDRFVSAGIKVRSDVFASFPCITPVLLRIVTTVCVMIGAAIFYVIVSCDNVKGCIMLTTTYRFSTTSKEKKDDSKIVFYAGAVGLLVIAFLIGMLVSGIKYKYCSRQRVSEENNDERHYATEESLEMTDQNPGTVLSRLPVPRNFVRHQLNETSENEHKDSIDSRYVNQMEDEGYLNPYQLIQKANIYKHDYMAINAEIPTEKQNDDYLHPYNSLLKHGMSEDHEYRCLRNKNKKIRV
ncbi:unnamed protein product [Mytilus coruscus]|uniref:Uncharacterized protein n=1 Tax=Mytilus coruscus TaxID=42192 RepID=A0A6J8AG83_MYTCO|nr:unnamed protein product [Mytilus coruscus]